MNYINATSRLELVDNDVDSRTKTRVNRNKVLNETIGMSLEKKQTDDQLVATVKLAQSGDVPAYTKLVMSHQEYLRMFIASRTPHTQDVDDIAQEAFVLAFNKLQDLKEPKAFKSWMCGIALNLVLNHNRKHQRATLEEPDIIASMIDSQQTHHNEEDDDDGIFGITALRSCILKLKHDGQELIRMHYIDGIPVKEITEQLGVKHSTVTMRLHRFRQLLRDCISKHMQ